jgi:hypothetical protein
MTKGQLTLRVSNQCTPYVPKFFSYAVPVQVANGVYEYIICEVAYLTPNISNCNICLTMHITFGGK